MGKGTQYHDQAEDNVEITGSQRITVEFPSDRVLSFEVITQKSTLFYYFRLQRRKVMSDFLTVFPVVLRDVIGKKHLFVIK